MATTAVTVTCPVCRKAHAIYRCDESVELSPSEKLAEAFAQKLLCNLAFIFNSIKKLKNFKISQKMYPVNNTQKETIHGFAYA